MKDLIYIIIIVFIALGYGFNFYMYKRYLIKSSIKNKFISILGQHFLILNNFNYLRLVKKKSDIETEFIILNSRIENLEKQLNKSEKENTIEESKQW